MRFLLTLAVLGAGFCLASDCGAAELKFYVGSSGPGAEGILASSLDSETGVLSQPKLLAKVPHASFQALSPDILDRLFRGSGWMRGAVIDFIDFQWWPVFNIADMAIMIGAATMIVAMLKYNSQIERTDGQ